MRMIRSDRSWEPTVNSGEKATSAQTSSFRISSAPGSKFSSTETANIDLISEINSEGHRLEAILPERHLGLVARYCPGGICHGGTRRVSGDGKEWLEAILPESHLGLVARYRPGGICHGVAGGDEWE